MSKNSFAYRSKSETGPAEMLVRVTPSDDADLPDGRTRSLFIGQAGTLTVTDRHGHVVTLVSAAGQYHPIRVSRVLASGTTASGIVALY